MDTPDRSGGYTDTTETLTVGATAWTLHSQSLPVEMGNHAVVNYNNLLYLTGGWEWSSGPGYTPRSDILLWDDLSKTWSKVGDMKEERAYHKMSLIEIDMATINACQ